MWPFKWKLSTCTFIWCYLKMKFGDLVEICLWPHLAVKGLKVLQSQWIHTIQLFCMVIHTFSSLSLFLSCRQANPSFTFVSHYIHKKKITHESMSSWLWRWLIVLFKPHHITNYSFCGTRRTEWADPYLLPGWRSWRLHSWWSSWSGWFGRCSPHFTFGFCFID